MNVNKRELPRIRLAIPKVCRDCGHKLLYVDELDTHDLRCLGPIRLVFIDDGDPAAEVSE
ncbi:MAG TPA: hypothetical protein VJW23_08735 [Propionibacteriaceae bacterium]|nr:hypothetical protein [Propionibacteriaceae bacterium]